MIRRRRLTVAAYLLLVGILTLAPLPADTADQLLGLGFDKVTHALLIAGFALLLLWRPEPLRPSVALAVAGLAAVVAGSIELAQIPLPYRSCELFDFAAGALGGFVATALYAALRGRGSTAGR